MTRVRERGVFSYLDFHHDEKLMVDLFISLSRLLPMECGPAPEERAFCLQLYPS